METGQATSGRESASAYVHAAFIAIIGFLTALFTFFGVNYLLAGLHSYV